MTPGSCLSRRGSPHCCLRCRRCWQRRSTAQSPCDLDGAVPTAMVSSSGCHTYSLSSLYFLFNSHHLVRKVTRAQYSFGFALDLQTVQLRSTGSSAVGGKCHDTRTGRKNSTRQLEDNFLLENSLSLTEYLLSVCLHSHVSEVSCSQKQVRYDLRNLDL